MRPTFNNGFVRKRSVPSFALILEKESNSNYKNHHTATCVSELS